MAGNRRVNCRHSLMLTSMIRHIGFRRLLPPLQLVLFGLLSLMAHWDRLGQKPCTQLWVSLEAPVFAQEGETLTLPPPCHEPITSLIATGLNLPAVFASLLVADTILHHTSDEWLFITSSPAILILWYWAGLWIDRRLGFVPVPHRRWRFSRTYAKVAYAISVFIGAFAGVVLLRFLFFRRTAIDGVLSIAFFCWSLFLVVVAWSNVRRSPEPTSKG